MKRSLLTIAFCLACPVLATAQIPAPAAAPAVRKAAPAPPPPGRATPAKKAPATAKPALNPDAQPMTVQIVRSAVPGCEPDCPEWIAAQGRIDAGTTFKFKTALKKAGARKLPVLVDSTGGSVHDGIAIGRLIRAKGLDVVVARTRLTPACTQGAADCKPLAKGSPPLALPETWISKCASSCAFLLAGGVNRYVGHGALVGLHRIRTIQIMRRVQQLYRITPGWSGPQKQLIDQRTIGTTQSVTQTSNKTYDMVEKYFVEMGVGRNIMPLLLSAPFESIRVLTAMELSSTQLSTGYRNGEQVILARYQAPAGAVVPQAGSMFDSSRFLLTSPPLPPLPESTGSLAAPGNAGAGMILSTPQAIAPPPAPAAATGSNPATEPTAARPAPMAATDASAAPTAKPATVKQVAKDAKPSAPRKPRRVAEDPPPSPF